MKKNRNYEIKNPKIQWQPIIELIVVLMTILGSTIPLYIHTDNKLDKALQGIQGEIKAMNQEMKDFHGRLCAIEERNKK